MVNVLYHYQYNTSSIIYSTCLCIPIYKFSWFRRIHFVTSYLLRTHLFYNHPIFLYYLFLKLPVLAAAPDNPPYFKNSIFPYIIYSLIYCTRYFLYNSLSLIRHYSISWFHYSCIVIFYNTLHFNFYINFFSIIFIKLPVLAASSDITPCRSFLLLIDIYRFLKNTHKTLDLFLLL